MVTGSEVSVSALGGKCLNRDILFLCSLLLERVLFLFMACLNHGEDR